jgi:hypothetical protein
MGSSRISVDCEWKNTAGAVKTLSMIVAAYDGSGRMAYCAADSKAVAAYGAASFHAELALPGNADGHFARDGYYGKVFLWDAATFAPMAEAFEFR